MVVPPTRTSRETSREIGRATGRGTSCGICGAPAAPGFALCFCCGILVRQLRMPLVPIVPIADYRFGDPLHRRLRSYKDAPVAETRESCVRWLGAMAEAWLVAVGTAGRARALGDWNLVATVPSSARPSGVPVDAVVRCLPSLACRHRTLLVRGPEPTGHLRAARGGFALGPGLDRDRLRGEAVLVVEDSVVTGARAQSAAAALRLAGARVTGVLALGRLVSDGHPGTGRTGARLTHPR